MALPHGKFLYNIMFYIGLVGDSDFEFDSAQIIKSQVAIK